MNCFFITKEIQKEGEYTNFMIATMSTENKIISREEIAKRLNVHYNTVMRYETYGWIPKAQKIKGLNGVFYTEKDYIELVTKLKEYGKLK